MALGAMCPLPQLIQIKHIIFLHVLQLICMHMLSVSIKGTMSINIKLNPEPLETPTSTQRV